MTNNIVLVGFMGSGKSSVGRLLATLTGYALVDTDTLIAEETKSSILEIFETKGEPYFRQLETETLRKLTGRLGLIIATGGGIIGSPENRTLLPQIGTVVWLDASTDHLHQRVRHSKRPMLQTDDPHRTLLELYAAREPLYREVSSIHIDSTLLSHRQTARAILTAIESLPPPTKSQ